MSLVRTGGRLVLVAMFVGFATASACAGPTASLVFSNASRLYTTGPLVVTATFSADITPTAPGITLTGVTGGVSVAGVEMTATSTLTVWTYTTTIQSEDTPGTHTLTLGASDGAGASLQAQPSPNTFVLDLTTPLEVPGSANLIRDVRAIADASQSQLRSIFDTENGTATAPVFATDQGLLFVISNPLQYALTSTLYSEGTTATLIDTKVLLDVNSMEVLQAETASSTEWATQTLSWGATMAPTTFGLAYRFDPDYPWRELPHGVQYRLVLQSATTGQVLDTVSGIDVIPRSPSTPAVQVTTPAPQANVWQGASVTFACTATDAFDGPLTGTALVWQRPDVGVFGQGPTVIVTNWAAGSHEVVLQATNSAWVTSSASVQLVVHGPQPPTSIVITAPGNGLSVPYGQSVTLSALVTDVVDGELDGTALLWRCPREGGVVATGKTTSHVFTNPATNTLHLSATNSIGLTAEATVTIKVEGPYVTVTIAQPAFDGFRVYFGDSLHLEGSCTDSWFGSLTGDAVRWTSNPPGLTGTGTSFTTTSLAPGVYLVALEATDPVGRSGRAERLLEILPDSHPSVLITQPLTAVSILHGDEVYFDGYAMDPDEGVLLPSQVRWESSADGLLATSPSLATTSLSTGVHDVSLVAINSRGRTSAATIAVTVLERPWVEVTVSSPRDGETTFAGDPVALVGAATDRVLGRLDGSSLVWRSDLQGDIGSGEQCSVTTLMIGTHRVELDASGSEGHVGQATATLHVQPEPPPLLSIVEPSGGCVVFPHEAVTLHAETLSGRGFMPVPEEQLHWSMDGVVLEGTGSTLSVTGLSLGTHEVQLSAPSLYGTTPTSTVTFQIVQPGTVIGLFSVHRLPVVTAQAPVPMFSGSGEPTSPAFVTDRALRLRVVNNSRRELRAKLGHPDQPLQFVASNELRGDDGQLLSRCMVDPTTDPATSMEVILPASAPVAVVDFSFKSPADWGSHVPSHDFFVEVCDTGGVPLVHVGGFAVLGREPLPPAAEVHQPIPGSVLRAGEALLAVGEGVDPIDGALAAEALSWSLDEGLPCGTGPLSWSAVLRRVSTA